jgi:hypothetical protein
MVEHSVRKFELGEFSYPIEDLLLTRQLENYIILRWTPRGTPVYGIKEKKWGDHRLDAVNLALIAVRIEFPSFYQEGLQLSNEMYLIPSQEEQIAESPRIAEFISYAGPGGMDPSRRNSFVRQKPNFVATPNGTKGRYWGQEPSETEVERLTSQPRYNPRRRGFGR